MKLSTPIMDLNSLLAHNLKRENERRKFIPHKKEEISILNSSSNCNVSSLKSLQDSETKRYIGLKSVESIVRDVLEQALPKIRFSISKVSGSKFTISAYKVKAEDIGLDKKYQESIDMFIPLCVFKATQKETVFGEVSEYDHRMGREENTRVVSEIVLHDDFDIVEKITFYVKREYDRNIEREQSKQDRANKLESKLAEHNITMEQLNEMISLKNSL